MNKYQKKQRIGAGTPVRSIPVVTRGNKCNLAGMVFYFINVILRDKVCAGAVSLQK